MQTKLSQEEQNIIQAIELAKKQREISISEFFTKNKHLLGFDNPVKSLLTTIKEAVDNSLDACEEANILPEVKVEIHPVSENRYRVIVEDNGPGIVKSQIPKIFGKLLYGSKFHKLSQSRGQQGIGISAAVLYAQLTTGKSAKITSKIAQNKPAHYYELHIDTSTNEPEIIKEKEVDWDKKTGTKIELELEGRYQKGKRSIEEYLKQTAIANPHVHLIYINPENQRIEYPRAINKLPIKPKEIKPHPDGIELGILISMLKTTKSRTLQGFLSSDFSRISQKLAKEICEKANLYPNARPSRIAKQEADNLLKAIRQTKFMAPSTDCLSPIGAEALEKGLRKEVDAEFYTSLTRSAAVYRGNPFIIEAALAYGGSLDKESPIEILRFANRVPLLYQQSACAITKSVASINWKPYGLQQSGKNIPVGPAVIVIHIASVWVPFTSESKEAIAHYPEIIKEIKLALQECGRQLGRYVKRKIKTKEAERKKSYIQKYIPHISEALKEILKLSERQAKSLDENLKNILERSRE
jgi:DNA topoisomerase-6 subunit B